MSKQKLFIQDSRMEVVKAGKSYKFGGIDFHNEGLKDVAVMQCLVYEDAKDGELSYIKVPVEGRDEA